MATTTYDDNTFSVRTIGARTNSGGTPVNDLTAEEDRLALSMLTEGWLLTPNSCKVTEGDAGTFNVVVGSTGARVDYYIVPGGATGQGNYITRLAAQSVVSLDAAHPTNPRKDEVYLVIEDNAYDGNARSLARLAVRKGDAAVVPVAPGADSGWNAYSLLATVDLPAGSADISAATITDERPETQLLVDASTLGGFPGSYFALDTHNHDSTYADIAHEDSRTGHPTATTSLDGLMSGADKLRLDGIEAGAQVNPTASEILTDLKTVDGEGSGLNADMLDGLHEGSFVYPAAHNHDTRYYTDTEVDALLLQHRNKPEGCFIGQTTTSGLYISGSAVIAPANAEERDDWGGRAGGSTTMQVDAEDAGWYLVTAQLIFSSNSNGYRQMRIHTIGVGTRLIVRKPAINGDVTVLNGFCTFYASGPTDQVQVELYQDSGSSLTINANSWMRVVALGH